MQNFVENMLRPAGDQERGRRLI